MSTWLSTAFFAPRRALRQCILQLNRQTEAIEAQGKALRSLQEAHQALDGKYLKLRGAFYGSRRSAPDEPENTQPPQKSGRLTPAEKAALLASVGLHGQGVGRLDLRSQEKT